MDMHRIDNPYSGEIVAERRLLTPSEVEGVVTRAFRAHKAWAKTAVADRVALCERFCQEFEKAAVGSAGGSRCRMANPLPQPAAEGRRPLHRRRRRMRPVPERLGPDRF